MKNPSKYLEREWLGTLSRIGQRLGVSTSKLRKFFIYSAFATIGLSFVLYLFLALLLWIKDFFIIKRPNVFDL